MDRSIGQRTAGTSTAGDALDGVARDASTITDVLATFDAEGFDGQFIVREGALLECATCRQRTPATRVGVDHVRRLEGASDPDDMLAVAALVCPACGARGTVVLGYGPVAALEDADVLTALESAPAPEPGRVEQPRDAET
jgi:hypothetical protein